MQTEQLAGKAARTEKALERLEEVGVIGPSEGGGYSRSDARIVESISRFRAGGYDERVGFTVHDAAEFLEPLEDLICFL